MTARRHTFTRKPDLEPPLLIVRCWRGRALSGCWWRGAGDAQLEGVVVARRRPPIAGRISPRTEGWSGSGRRRPTKRALHAGKHRVGRAYISGYTYFHKASRT